MNRHHEMEKTHLVQMQKNMQVYPDENCGLFMNFIEEYERVYLTSMEIMLLDCI